MTTPDTVQIQADRTAVKRLGNWTTSRHIEVRSRRGYVLLDLRSPEILDGDIEVAVTLDRAMVKLLVPEDAVIDSWELQWRGRGKIKDWIGQAGTDGRRVKITGVIANGEIRVHRGGVAVLSAMFSRAFAQEAVRAHREGTPITVLDPANPAYDPKRAAVAPAAEAAAAASPAVGYDEHVPVLIVGGGYAGLASSLFLSHHAIQSLLVDRHPAFSLQGRARGINWRTMEIYRSLGIADSVLEEGKPFDDNAGVARCTTLAGAWEWLYEAEEPRGLPEHTAAEFCLADQSVVEPVLMEAALGHGADQRFNTTMVSFEADEDGITAVVEDRASGQRRTVRADYLIAADGSRSPIRTELSIDRPGPGVIKSWVSIVFEADLSSVVSRHAMFWIVLNSQLGFASFVTTAIPGRWAMSVGYDPEKDSPADFTTQRCVQVVRAGVGIPDPEVTVLDMGSWEEAVGVAERYRSDRVFLTGDSAHVWPPAGAMGANSAVQDAHNLAWKLAAVIKGYAGASLLDTYEAERRPIAQELARLTVRRQEARFNNDEKYQDDVDDVVCILGQRYLSSAILGAEHDTVFGDKLDLRGRPGERAPHLWLDNAGTRISVHDLFYDSFVLLTGSAGTPWVDAAATLAQRTFVGPKCRRRALRSPTRRAIRSALSRFQGAWRCYRSLVVVVVERQPDVIK